MEVGVPVTLAMGEIEDPLKVAEMTVPTVKEARGDEDMDTVPVRVGVGPTELVQGCCIHVEAGE